MDDSPTPPFYVSVGGNDANPGTRNRPFLTLGRARTAVQALTASMSSNITVYLRNGRYFISAAETFTPSDSGKNGHNVVWASYPNETAWISGGVQITGWADQGSGLWRASTSLSNIRQVYVNNVRATRARFPKTGTWGSLVFWDEGSETVEIQAGHADEALLAEELVILGHGVNGSILRIASVSGAFVTPQSTEQTRLFTQEYPGKGPGNPYYLQGGLSLCTAQGEWHLDTTNDFLYYRPLPGEDMTTAEVIVPTVENLLTVIGTNLDTPVTNIRFERIGFEHSAWNIVNTEGFVGDQGPTYFLTTLPADQISSYPSGRMACAVKVEIADEVHFWRCKFRHIGADALHFYRAATDCSAIGNGFWDLSGGAVFVDLAMLGNTADARVPCRRVTVSNNYVEKFGQEYVQSYGLGSAYVDSPIYDHNEVTDGPYVGLGMGWGWENAANTMDNALVRRNKLWNLCYWMRDSAPLYTLSLQNGSLYEHNYIFDVHPLFSGSHPVNGIYLDNGTSQTTVQNNVVDVIPDATNIVFQNGNGPGVSLNNNDATDGIGVVAAAGLEAEYTDIRTAVKV